MNNELAYDVDQIRLRRRVHQWAWASLHVGELTGYRHIRFSKLLSNQKLSQIILSYFSNALTIEQGKRSFQISGKLSSFAKITNKKIARHVTLVVVSRPMFTLVTPPPSWSG